MEHTDFETLGTELRDAVETRTGRIRSSETASAGLNSEIAAFLDTDTGPVFLKGLRTDHRGAARQRREALINPYVRGISPRLLWQDEVAGWSLLAFELVQDARHADYSPDSADLPRVVEAMDSLSQVPCPEIPGMKTAEQRWSGYVDDPADASCFAGSTLLHTDFNPLNILIDPAKVWIIDWAWPTRGAAFVDPACFLLRLMADGHDAKSAESWASRCRGWIGGDQDAINLFALANARLWREIADQNDVEWTQRMADGADAWARHRFVSG